MASRAAKRSVQSSIVPSDSSATLSIGQVLALLSRSFPDLSPSKLRFLEERQVVFPARTENGYRKFSESDVERLRFVLTLQRDYFLPLKVIREQLENLDAGRPVPDWEYDDSEGKRRRTSIERTRFAKVVGSRVTHLLEESPIPDLDIPAQASHSDFMLAVELAARRMHNALATRTTYDDVVGPFFDAAGLARRQNVDEAEIRARASEDLLLGLQTSDDELVFPTFQFTANGEVIPGLLETTRILAEAMNHDLWAASMWLVGRSESFSGQSALAYLLQGQTRQVLQVAEVAASRLKS